MKKLGAAVIGTGFWGKNHARVYNEIEETDLLAVCDIDAERAKQWLNSTVQNLTRTFARCSKTKT